ncbi:multicopper oxidase domain-containing protein [Streptomyces griseoaurantiacus]|uniref:multicopper oxidase domain-containing protein n=1 Tax=Streptomyces TaxID=1883 RepID=UPI0029ACCC01|nr:multicopper oxidase domain-containing protein [Streptomyces sp. ME02-6978.2a]MDX3358257.1 multicopper oxidase domain-containing protein [Streptomyces sp. ME02-6978.2a]
MSGAEHTPRPDGRRRLPLLQQPAGPPGDGGPGGSGGSAGRSGRAARQDMRSRQVRAHLLVAGWAGLALLAAAAPDTLPVARWLAVHLLLLGAATTAIVVWSEHFAVAMLHAPVPDRRWSTARLAGVNVSVAGVLLAVWAGPPALIAAACAALAVAVTAHLVVLVRLGRGALGGRLAPVVAYYRAAAVALAAGVVAGGTLATGSAGATGHTALRLAHVHVTLLGWIGLPVLGTLFMLWPTVLGVRMHARTTPTARRVLALTGGGLTVAVTGLAGPAVLPGPGAAVAWRAATVAGLAAYAAGVAVAVRLWAATVRRGRKAVSVAAAWSLAASAGWLTAGVVHDLVLFATRSPAAAQDGVESLVPLFLLGFVAQVLIGALTYLLPVVTAVGPKARAGSRAVLERAWQARLAALNLAVALLVLPLPGPAATLGVVLAAGAAVAFLGLVVTVLGRRAGAVVTPRAPVLIGTAAAAVATALAVLVAGGGAGGGTTTASGAGTGGAATGTRTVAVSLHDMRVSPSRIEVPRGTALRLKVTNRDAQRHDLRIEDGPTTSLLSDGQTRTLDLGTLTGDRKGWCTVPGHRAAGMTLDIAATGTAGGSGTQAAAGDTKGHDGHSGTASRGSGPDLSADFSVGWHARDAALPPAAGGRPHRVELHVRQRTVEVAPGVRQRMWTFGGTAPGPTLRGKVGDVFEVTLVNDDTTMGHGVDFHAGALSPDAPMRTLEPGERLVYRFRAERAGAWLYHCSTASMLQHMGNGMYGAVIIDPPGLDEVDREYLLVSSELYLGTPGSAAQVEKMRADTPDAWVFNGVAAQYAKAPLRVRAGERVRFWVVAAGPSDGVAFHVVGTVFDTVYKEGAYLLRPGDGDGGSGGSQVLDLAVAQGGFVETELPAAGHYPFVDHDMRHAEAGARGVVEVR